MNRLTPLFLTLGAALLNSACVITPGTVRVGDATELARMSEQALKTCGEGQVKEVSAKSYSCK
jgi:hypothetical protein